MLAELAQTTSLRYVMQLIMVAKILCRRRKVAIKARLIYIPYRSYTVLFALKRLICYLLLLEHVQFGPFFLRFFDALHCNQQATEISKDDIQKSYRLFSDERRSEEWLNRLSDQFLFHHMTNGQVNLAAGDNASVSQGAGEPMAVV